MYGLPKDVDLSFLIGSDVRQVCIGINELILRLGGQFTVTIEGAFATESASGARARFEDYRQAAPFLVQLLGEAITLVQREGRGDLVLGFGVLGKLILLDDSEQFEAYIIEGKDQRIIV